MWHAAHIKMPIASDIKQIESKQLLAERLSHLTQNWTFIFPLGIQSHIRDGLMKSVLLLCKWIWLWFRFVCNCSSCIVDKCNMINVSYMALWRVMYLKQIIGCTWMVTREVRWRYHRRGLFQAYHPSRRVFYLVRNTKILNTPFSQYRETTLREETGVPMYLMRSRSTVNKIKS